ncbi:MAG TPA: hypothetical protein VF164_09175 [Trueperaceae bacterium]
MKGHARRLDKLEAIVQPDGGPGQTELWEEAEDGLFHCGMHPELGLTRQQLSARATEGRGRQIIAIYGLTPPPGVLVALPRNGRDGRL